MTYRELLNKLKNLSNEQLNSTVTIHDMVEDEVYGFANNLTLEISGPENNLLDENHPVLCIRA